MGTTPEILATVIKLPLEEAILKIKEAGFRARIESEDGEFYMMTCDYEPRRVSLNIEKGIVTSAFMG